MKTHIISQFISHIAQEYRTSTGSCCTSTRVFLCDCSPRIFIFCATVHLGFLFEPRLFTSDFDLSLNCSSQKKCESRVFSTKFLYQISVQHRFISVANHFFRSSKVCTTNSWTTPKPTSLFSTHFFLLHGKAYSYDDTLKNHDICSFFCQ